MCRYLWTIYIRRSLLAVGDGGESYIRPAVHCDCVHTRCKSQRRTMSTSTSTALVVLTNADTNSDDRISQWTRIYQSSGAVVLYNPTSHALAFHKDHPPPPPLSPPPSSLCPYCGQNLPNEHTGFEFESRGNSRAPNYFKLLGLANEVTGSASTSNSTDQSAALRANSFAQGYFESFFEEEYRLGMGANGSVYLCRVRLVFDLCSSTNVLRHFSTS